MEALTSARARRAWLATPSWLDSPWVTAGFGLIVALLTWDELPIVPTVGGDPSWILGINLGAQAGLDHGAEIVFTYGPLGWLDWPLVLDGLLATLASVYLLAIRVALAASLLWAARRSLPWIPAALLALAVAAVTSPAAGSVALALTALWCLVALQDPAPPWAARLIVFGGGALAALELMIKLNIGLTILLLVVITTLALPGPRIRNTVTMLGVLVGTFSILWLVSGQALADIDDYIGSSFQVITGYSESAQLESPNVAWDWWAALIVGLGALAATAYAAAHAAQAPIARRLAMLVVVGLLVFSLVKYGFVRHDGDSAGVFFGGVCVVWVALRWQGAARLVACAAVAVTALAYFPVTGQTLRGTFAPGVTLDQLRTLIVPGERQQARDDARAALQATHAVDPRIIERIGDAPVDARPWEISLVWAYDLNWRPLPVIQDYLANTPTLDRLNAAALISDHGPRFVLRHLGYANSALIGIDGHLTSFDSPLATQALLCHFRPTLTSASHQLLVRAENRCGEPRELNSTTAEYGERVAVPDGRGDEAVFARIEGAAAHGIESLRSFAYRAAIREIALGDARARLPARNAESGLLIAAPPEVDFPAPFGLAPNVAEIAADSEGGFATSDGPLRIEFFALPVSPAPRG